MTKSQTSRPVQLFKLSETQETPNYSPYIPVSYYLIQDTGTSIAYSVVSYAPTRAEIYENQLRPTSADLLIHADHQFSKHGSDRLPHCRHDALAAAC